MAACPKCGWQLANAARCPRCGVDIDDYRAMLRAASEAIPTAHARAAPEAPSTPERSISSARPAGFWIRFAAAAIDGMILVVAETILSTSAWSVFADASPAVLGAATRAFGTVMAALYTIVLHWRRGQTLGKMAVGIRVVTVDGGPLSLGRSVLRQLATALSALLLGIGYLMVAVRVDKRALHDLIAGTRVERLA